MLFRSHFKGINDTHGHNAGDKAIFAVAHELMSGPWHAGRLGGEEFALLVEGDIEAAAGIVSTHAHTICPAMPHRTAERRRVAPTPTIAPKCRPLKRSATMAGVSAAVTE